ncbi:MAG TPA: hypothetical protein PKA41_07960 [Verrucomicrobiota bacterium]|nr:hypothetical protein [Verrucomicrobiota bacterium]
MTPHHSITPSLILGVLISAFSLQPSAFAATVTGQVYSVTGQGMATAVRFVPQSTPYADSQTIIGGTVVRTADTNGAFSTQLRAGRYQVQFPAVGAVMHILVPNDSHTYNVNDLSVDIPSTFGYISSRIAAGSGITIGTNLPGTVNEVLVISADSSTDPEQVAAIAAAVASTNTTEITIGGIATGTASGSNSVNITLETNSNFHAAIAEIVNSFGLASSTYFERNGGLATTGVKYENGVSGLGLLDGFGFLMRDYAGLQRIVMTKDVTLFRDTNNVTFLQGSVAEGFSAAGQWTFPNGTAGTFTGDMFLNAGTVGEGSYLAGVKNNDQVARADQYTFDALGRLLGDASQLTGVMSQSAVSNLVGGGTLSYAGDGAGLTGVPPPTNAITALASNVVSASRQLQLSYTPDGSATNLTLQTTNTWSGLWMPTLGSVGFLHAGKDVLRIDQVGIKSYGTDKSKSRWYEVTNWNAGFGMDASINLSKDKGFQVQAVNGVTWAALSDRKLAVNGVLADGQGAGHGQMLIYSNWTEVQKLQPPNGGAALRFAYSSSLDGTNLWISEIMRAAGNGTQGAVYLYYLSNNVKFHGPVQTIIAPDDHDHIVPNATEEYGHTMRVSGTNAAIGVLYGNTFTDPHINYGSGYVGTYWLSNGWWHTRQFLFNVGARTNSLFGYALDMDETGTNLWIQAVDDNALEYGKLVWFQLHAETWTNINRLTVNSQSDAFGKHVSAYKGRMIIGAPTSFSSFTGKVHFATYEGTNWTWRGSHAPTDVDPGTEIQIRYGWNGGLEQRGDIAIVGIPWVDSAGRKSSINNGTNGMGKVHVFKWTDTNVALVDVLAPSTRQFGDLFGMQAYTDGTNIWAVSAGAYRATPTPTNFMRIYWYAPPPSERVKFKLLVKDAWTLTGGTTVAPLSGSTQPALGNAAASTQRWKSSYSFHGVWGFWPAGSAGDSHSFNWMVPSYGKRNWQIWPSMLATNGFTNVFAFSVTTLSTNGDSVMLLTPSGGQAFRYQTFQATNFIKTNISLTRISTNGGSLVAGSGFLSDPGEYVFVRLKPEAGTATNIWVFPEMELEGW